MNPSIRLEVPFHLTPEAFCQSRGLDSKKVEVTTVDALCVEGKDNVECVVKALTPEIVESLCENNPYITLVLKIQGMADQSLTLYNKGSLVVSFWKQEGTSHTGFTCHFCCKDELAIDDKIASITMMWKQQAKIGDILEFRKGPVVDFSNDFSEELQRLVPTESKKTHVQCNMLKREII